MSGTARWVSVPPKAFPRVSMRHPDPRTTSALSKWGHMATRGVTAVNAAGRNVLLRPLSGQGVAWYFTSLEARRPYDFET